MVDLSKAGFDTKAFTERLTTAIDAALGRSLELFNGEIVRCLALDIHPCNGFLNLCMRVSDDEPDWLADWKYTSFAEAYGSANWPEGLVLAQYMEQVTERKYNENPNGDNLEYGRAFLICAVHAFEDSRICAHE